MNKHQDSLRRLTLFGRVIAFVLVVAGSGYTQESTAESDGHRFFSEKISPLLKSRCLACHSHTAGEMEGGLTLDSERGWSEGGGRGPALVRGKPLESLLINAVRRVDSKFQMPPEEELSNA
jgi:hypothetical protein